MRMIRERDSERKRYRKKKTKKELHCTWKGGRKEKDKGNERIEENDRNHFSHTHKFEICDGEKL